MMRIARSSHIRPVIRRRDQAVMAWVFRLTLEQDGQTAFEDIPIDLGVDLRPITVWTQREVLGLVGATAHNLEDKRVAKLHSVLDARITYDQPAVFDLELLRP